MAKYEELPVVEMTTSELLALEDRSTCLGRGEAGQRVRCDFAIWHGGTPQWVVCTFYVNEERKADLEQLADFCGIMIEPWLYVRPRFERVVFTDGPPPRHSIAELKAQLARQKALAHG